MEEHIADAWTWFAANAQAIAMVEFGVLVVGGVGGVIGFLLNFRRFRRESCKHEKERKRAQERHDDLMAQNRLLLDKMDEMIGKPAAEQRRIVQDAREHIGISESYETKLISPDGKVKDVRRGRDES